MKYAPQGFGRRCICAIGADSRNVEKPLPPDDPADVKTLQDLHFGKVWLDGNGNVTALSLSGDNIQRFPVLLTRIETPAPCSLWSILRRGPVPGRRSRRGPRSKMPMLRCSDRGLAQPGGHAEPEELASLPQCRDRGRSQVDRELKRLEVLTLQRAGIADACLKEIAGLPNLNRLDLNNNSITDRGLVHSKGMRLEFGPEHHEDHRSRHRRDSET